MSKKERLAPLDWHESLVAILERRQRLSSEVKRSRTLSAESRRLALDAIEAEAYAAAQRVFPRDRLVGVWPAAQTAGTTAQLPVMHGTGVVG